MYTGMAYLLDMVDNTAERELILLETKYKSTFL